MRILYGQTYSIPSSHLSYEEVTPWDDGTFTVVPGALDAFDHATLDEIENAGRDGELLAHLIREELLTSRHDLCDSPWTPDPHRPVLFRAGRCPTCDRW